MNQTEKEIGAMFSWLISLVISLIVSGVILSFVSSLIRNYIYNHNLYFTFVSAVLNFGNILFGVVLIGFTTIIVNHFIKDKVLKIMENI